MIFLSARMRELGRQAMDWRGEFLQALGQALQQVARATQQAWANGAQPSAVLANAVPYMQAFGHTVLAWLWLEVALAALRRDAMQTLAFTQGKTGAAAYFYHCSCLSLVIEQLKTPPWLASHGSDRSQAAFHRNH